MFISISKSKIESEGGKKYVIDDQHYIVVFRSPNHPVQEIEGTLTDFSNFINYTNVFVNDAFLYVDSQKGKVYILRDWPGNVPFFYKYDRNEKLIFISDNISNIVKVVNNTKISSEGIHLFLNYRKHYHSHTIYEDIETLHPGLYIELSNNNSSFSIHHWYKPYKNVSINRYDVARETYLDALNVVLQQTIVKEKPIALMFSGGSDSVMLLDRIIELGYNNINLFAICIKGNNSQFDYANEKAKIFGLEVNPIYVDKLDVLASWQEQYKHCYHYLSDLRIDGIFSPSIIVYKYLNKFFKEKPATIVWGSQYALISPVISSKAIYGLTFVHLISKIKLILPFSNITINRLVLLLLNRIPVLDRKQVSSETYEAFKQLYLDCLNNHKNIVELIDLVLSTNYNACKHWWMDWRGKIKQIYFPNAINVYPFHDRGFQERSMPIAFKVRIGGFKNIFKMPKTYKHFFYSLMPKKIPVSSVKRGNYKTLPEFFSLFKNEEFFNTLTVQLNDKANAKIVKLALKEGNATIPETYEKFLELNYQEVEKLSGILFLIIKTRTDKVKI